MDVESITQQILGALEELNLQLPPEAQLDVSVSAPLLQPEGQLDSLGVVNLILLLEERVERALSVRVSLTDERTLAHSERVFRDVPSLADHLLTLIEQPMNDAATSG